MATARASVTRPSGRIWRTFRLQPHRTESFKISPGSPDRGEEPDRRGLYVAPPANAVVFSGVCSSPRPAHRRPSALMRALSARPLKLPPVTLKSPKESTTQAAG
jgi:hypothetical protein